MIVGVNLEVLACEKIGHSHAVLLSPTLGKVLADQLVRGLLRLADLKERVLVVDAIAYTLLAEVGVSADGTHVADTTDGISFTAIANDFLVNNVVLLLILELEVFLKHFSEASVAVLLDLLANDASQVSQLAGYDGTTAFTLAAGQTLLVNLGAVALEAGELLEAFGIILITGDKQVTCDVSVLDLDLHLRGLVLRLGNETVTTLVLHVSLDLGRHVAHLHTRVNHLFTSHDAGGVAASLTSNSAGHNISTDGNRLMHGSVGSNCNLVSHIGKVGNGRASFKDALS